MEFLKMDHGKSFQRKLKRDAAVFIKDGVFRLTSYPLG